MAEVYYSFQNEVDLNELAQLAATNYTGGGITNNQYLEWQYYKNPWGKPFMVVTRDKEKNDLVGQYLVIPYEYIMKDKPVKGTLSLNTITREDFRGRGLFTNMALQTYQECTNQGYHFTVGFPNQQSFHGLHKKLNFSLVGQVPLLIKTYKPFKLVWEKLTRKKSEKHGDEILLNFENESLDGVDFKIFNYESDKYQYEQFWNQYRKNLEVTLNKSWEYIEWRYSKIPLRKYYTIKAEADGQIKALVVLRAEHTLGSRTAIFMDFMCMPDCPVTGSELIRFINRTLKKNNIELFAGLTCKWSMEYKILRKRGLLRVPKKMMPQPIPYMIRVHKEFENSSKLLNFNNWNITFGDYDIF